MYVDPVVRTVSCVEPAAVLALARDLFGAQTPGYVLGILITT